MSRSELVSKLFHIIDHLKMMALVISPFACGFVFLDQKNHRLKKDYHDHPGKNIDGQHVLDEYYQEVLYDPKKHGEIEDFIPEGGIVPGYPTKEGFILVHRHPKQGYPTSSYGPYETMIEPKAQT